MVVYLVGALTLVSLVQTVALWRMRRSLGALDRFEDKLAHVNGVLSLLTDTTETGFQSLATQMNRPVGPPAPRVTTRRVVAAVKRGRTPKQIAVDQQLAEGEVRLRMALDKQLARPRGSHAKEA